MNIEPVGNMLGRRGSTVGTGEEPDLDKWEKEQKESNPTFKIHSEGTRKSNGGWCGILVSWEDLNI